MKRPKPTRDGLPAPERRGQLRSRRGRLVCIALAVAIPLEVPLFASLFAARAPAGMRAIAGRRSGLAASRLGRKATFCICTARTRLPRNAALLPRTGFVQHDVCPDAAAALARLQANAYW